MLEAFHSFIALNVQTACVIVFLSFNHLFCKHYHQHLSIMRCVLRNVKHVKSIIKLTLDLQKPNAFSVLYFVLKPIFNHCLGLYGITQLGCIVLHSMSQIVLQLLQSQLHYIKCVKQAQTQKFLKQSDACFAMTFFDNLYSAHLLF